VGDAAAIRSRPGARDIVIVGIDDRTSGTIAAPPGLWHESIGMALVRIASAKPRAIGIDLPLPERSYDMRPGLDRALLVGLAAARENGPLVASLSIDARTRGVRPIHPPSCASWARSASASAAGATISTGVTRRFSLAVPPRMARSRPCPDGFAARCRGAAPMGCSTTRSGLRIGYVPLQTVAAHAGRRPAAGPCSRTASFAG
jgi:CHASE2 domain-containing sensor protein